MKFKGIKINPREALSMDDFRAMEKSGELSPTGYDPKPYSTERDRFISCILDQRKTIKALEQETQNLRKALQVFVGEIK